MGDKVGCEAFHVFKLVKLSLGLFAISDRLGVGKETS